MNKKNILFWAIAIIISVASAYFQRQTGPTKPYRGVVNIAGQEIDVRLIRTFPKPMDAPARVLVEDEGISGYFRYRCFPSQHEWDTLPLVRRDDYLIAFIPQQDPAGKIEYQVVLETGEERVKLSEEPIVIRFRGSVPAWAMIPHIILMFAAMLFSNRAALAAIGKQKTYNFVLLTFITFVAGGLIFGPIVQKYAFGDWWTGWPFGTDLTDNKTAFAFIFWIIAFVKARKNPMHQTWVIAAAMVLLLIYYIPHSLLGSELECP